MTAVRFTAAQDGDLVRQLRALVSQGPVLGMSQPMRIEVGWYQCSGAGFQIHTEPIS
jgi:hypothetical protein